MKTKKQNDESLREFSVCDSVEKVVLLIPHKSLNWIGEDLLASEYQEEFSSSISKVKA